MTTTNLVSPAAEQPALCVEHRVIVTTATDLTEPRAQKLEKVLDKFYLEHGPGWELTNVFKVGGTEFPSPSHQLMLVLQRRSYRPR